MLSNDQGMMYGLIVWGKDHETQRESHPNGNSSAQWAEENWAGSLLRIVKTSNSPMTSDRCCNH